MNAEPKLTETQAATDNSNGGMSDEEFARVLAHIEKRKNNPGYFERWEAQVAEYRERGQAQAERELVENGK